MRTILPNYGMPSPLNYAFKLNYQISYFPLIRPNPYPQQFILIIIQIFKV